jgi:hypothetical protein
MHTVSSRLDRCFIDASTLDSKEGATVRQYLRVIAGRRVHSGDPKVLTEEQLTNCIKACPPRAQ